MKKLLAILFIFCAFTSIAQTNRNTLKSYFETGDVPTQSQFELLIDAMYNKAEEPGLKDSSWIDTYIKSLPGYVETSANATELNILDGGLITTTELNYSVGLTGNIQTQLNAKGDSVWADSTFIKSSDVETAVVYTTTEVDSIVANLTATSNSIQVLASPPSTGNVYIDSTTQYPYYYSTLSGYWRTPFSIADSISGIDKILNDGNTVAWYDASDAITITEVGGAISAWRDKLGSGNDLAQATGFKQPSYVGDTAVSFDGGTHYLEGTFTLTQPEMIYLKANIKTADSDDIGVIFNGVSSNSGVLRWSISGSPQAWIYAPDAVGYPNFTRDQYEIFRVLFDGANSKLIVNDGTAATGNAGANDMGGFLIGAAASGSLLTQMDVKEVIIRKVADSAATESAIYNYLLSQ